MSEIDYEDLVQDGLRNVVKYALKRTADEGTIGLHHFYISFKTDFPGVQIPDALLDQHPDEMTIVLQHQFWGLEVNDEGFFVSLSFNDDQEQIFVPFLALLSFMDPSVKFGLQFTPPEVDELPSVELIEAEEGQIETGEKKDNVVTLDAFRKNK